MCKGEVFCGRAEDCSKAECRGGAGQTYSGTGGKEGSFEEEAQGRSCQTGSKRNPVCCLAIAPLDQNPEYWVGPGSPQPFPCHCRACP